MEHYYYNPVKQVWWLTVWNSIFCIILNLLTQITKSYENLHALVFFHAFCIDTIGFFFKKMVKGHINPIGYTSWMPDNSLGEWGDFVSGVESYFEVGWVLWGEIAHWPGSRNLKLILKKSALMRTWIFLRERDCQIVAYEWHS